MLTTESVTSSRSSSLTLEDLQTDRALPQGRIKQNLTILVRNRDPLQQVADQVALGVDHADADPGLNVLEGEIQEQRALAAGGGAGCPQVLPPVALGDADRSPLFVLQAPNTLPS